MSNFENKLGLSYINERDSSFRYADINKQEKWLLPISDYTPLCEIKRGQLVSIATPKDIHNFATKYVDENFPLNLEFDDLESEDLREQREEEEKARYNSKVKEIYDNLMNFKETFVTLTDVSIHDHAVGIAREYSEGYKYSDSGEMPDHIHVIQCGQVLYDPTFNNSTGLSLDSTVTVTSDTEKVNLDYNSESARRYEYLPEFLNNYKENIGKTVYAKGGEPGNLTIIPEEGYLSHRNIIKVGIIADANDNQDNDANNYFGVIEVLLEGDQRGVIDSTQLELVLDEDINILKDDPARVFAIGCDNDARFKFKLGLYLKNAFNTSEQFISLRRLDGKSYTIFLGSNDTPVITDADDKAYIDYSLNQTRLNDLDVRQVIHAETGTVDYTGQNVFDKLDIDEINDGNSLEAWNKIKEALNRAITFIGEVPEYKSDKYESITGFIVSEQIDNNRDISAVFEANKFGGYFELYVSKNLQFISDSYVYNHGSYENRGKAVLADIRVESRCRTLAGIYNSGNYNKIQKAGTKAIFLKLGIFNCSDTSFNFERGATYYLRDHGILSKTLMEYQGKACKIGTAETSTRFFVDARDSIKVLTGHEALGIIRPTADGNANHGYFVMDGVTTHSKEEFKVLYEYLLQHYSEAMLTSEEDDSLFVIPKTTITTPEGEEGVFCQIRYIPDVFETVESAHEPYKVYQDKLSDTAEVKDLDISDLVLYGTKENKLFIDNIEQYDIKLYVDLRDDVADTDEKEWTLIPEGFHNYNNNLYYGYKWTINKTEPADAHNLFGTWTLQCQIDGARQLKDDTTQYDVQPKGIMYERDPYQAPISLAGHYYKVYIARRNLWQGEFNLGRLVEHLESKIKYDLRKYEIDGILDDVTLKGSTTVDSNKLNIKLNKNTANNFRLVTVANTGEEASIAVIMDSNGNLGIADPDSYIENSTDNAFAVNKEVRGNKAEIDARLDTLETTVSSLVEHEEAEDVEDVENRKSITEKENGAERVDLGYNDNNTNLELFNSFDIYTKSPADKLEKIVSREITRNGQALINKITTDCSSTQYVFDYDCTVPYKNVVISDQNGFHFKKSIAGSDDFDYTNILAASFDQKSRAESKVILKELFPRAYSESDNLDLDKFTFEDTSVENDNANQQKLVIDNALQMFYELPTAVYRYKNMKDTDKRNFGVILNRVSDMVKNISFSNSQAIDNQSAENIAPDKLGFTYSQEEIDSIKAYMNMLMSENDESLNISSAVGMLSKAAGEAQKRLISLETSVFGYDAEGIPGERSIDTEGYSLIENNSTLLGLNRLVKYLSREIFGSDDPNVVFLLGRDDEDTSTWTSDISRLDYFDNEINGIKSNDDIPVRIPLNKALGETYFNLNFIDSNDNLLDNYKEEDGFFDTDDQKVTDPEYTQESFFDERANVSKGLNITSEVDEEDVDKKGFINSFSVNDEDKYKGNEFDGLNEAVNRIANKLNNTTAMLTDFDTANTQPIALDRIRQNIATLIDDVYNTTYEDKYEPNMLKRPEPFIKQKESRIDVSQHKLFDYTKAILSPQAPDGTDITLKDNISRDKNGYAVDLTLVDTYNQDSSNTSNASLLDIIADQINGDGHILRADKAQNSIVTNESTFSDAYRYRLTNTIFDRLNNIEKFLDRVEQFTSPRKHFENDAYIKADPVSIKQSTLLEPTYLDKFLSVVDAYLGIDFNKNIIMTRAADSDVLNDTIEFSEKLNDEQKLIQAGSVSKPSNTADTRKDNFETALYFRKYLQFAIEDLAARLKIREYEDRSLDLGLGNEYLSNVWNNRLSPTEYRNKIIAGSLVDGIDTESEIENTLRKFGNTDEAFTLSSDMKAILRLLNGRTYELSEDNYAASYDHYAEGEEFSKHTDTITKLYDDLYNLPSRFVKDETAEDPNLYDLISKSNVKFINEFDKDAETLYDFQNLKNGYSDSDSSTPLSNKNIDEAVQINKTNRFDVIEAELQKMQNLIGQSLLAKYDRVSGKLTSKTTVGDGELDKETVTKIFVGQDEDIVSDLEDTSKQWNDVDVEDENAEITSHDDLARDVVHTDNILQETVNNFKLATNYSQYEDISELFDNLDTIYTEVFLDNDKNDITQKRFIKDPDPSHTRYSDIADMLRQRLRYKDPDYINKLITIDLQGSYDAENTYAALEQKIYNYENLQSHSYDELEGRG